MLLFSSQFSWICRDTLLRTMHHYIARRVTSHVVKCWRADVRYWETGWLLWIDFENELQGPCFLYTINFSVILTITFLPDNIAVIGPIAIFIFFFFYFTVSFDIAKSNRWIRTCVFGEVLIFWKYSSIKQNVQTLDRKNLECAETYVARMFNYFTAVEFSSCFDQGFSCFR